MNEINNNKNIKTQEISKKLLIGKHTTTHSELFIIENGLIADTPGFSSFNIEKMPKKEISKNFIEFKKYKEKCQFRDCIHENEKNCGVKNAVILGEIIQSRYKNYIKLLGESCQ